MFCHTTTTKLLLLQTSLSSSTCKLFTIQCFPFDNHNLPVNELVAFDYNMHGVLNQLYGGVLYIWSSSPSGISCQTEYNFFLIVFFRLLLLAVAILTGRKVNTVGNKKGIYLQCYTMKEWQFV